MRERRPIARVLSPAGGVQSVEVPVHSDHTYLAYRRVCDIHRDWNDIVIALVCREVGNAGNAGNAGWLDGWLAA